MRSHPMLAVTAAAMCCFALSGCVRSEERGRLSATPESGQPAAPRASAPPAPAPAPQSADSPPDDDVACKVDSDCVVTRVQEGGCCDACAPRAVSQRGLAAIQRRQADCQSRGSVCPEMPCAPPRGVPVPTCQAGVCGVRLERQDPR